MGSGVANLFTEVNRMTLPAKPGPDSGPSPSEPEL